MAFNAAAKAKREEEELKALMKEAEEAQKAVVEEKTPKEEDDPVPTPTQEKPKDKPEEKTSETEGDPWEKRYGDLRRFSQKKEQEYKERLEALEDKLKQAETASFKESLPATEEELDEWRNENPQASALVETLASQIAQTKFEEYKSDLEDLRSTVLTDRERNARDRAEITIKKAHPDFERITGSDEFHDWVEKQIKAVQTAVFDSTDAEEVIWAIDTYKNTLKKNPTPTPKKDKVEEAALEVKAKAPAAIDAEATKGKIKESEIDAMDEKEYLEREDEILEAQRSGNIIWDISGGGQ